MAKRKSKQRVAVEPAEVALGRHRALRQAAVCEDAPEDDCEGN